MIQRKNIGYRPQGRRRRLNVGFDLFVWAYIFEIQAERLKLVVGVERFRDNIESGGASVFLDDCVDIRKEGLLCDRNISFETKMQERVSDSRRRAQIGEVRGVVLS